MQPTIQQRPPSTFAKNIAERPFVQTPQGAPGQVTVVTPPKKQAGKSKLPPLKLIIGGIVLLIVGVGGLIGFILSQQTQDVRQQASSPTGVAELFVTPDSSPFPAGSEQTLTFKVNMNVADKQIAGVQFIADITGTIPDDLLFTPAQITGLNPVSQTIIDTVDGKQLTVGFLTTPPSTFTTTASDLTLGTLTFTAPSDGSMTLAFDPVLSKVLEVNDPDVQDILHTPGTVSYSFESTGIGGGNDPTPTNTPVPTSTQTAPTATPGSGGDVPTATPTSTATLTPTATPTLPPGVTPTNTPIPTSTPTGTITPSSTPTPTTYSGVGGGTSTSTPTPVSYSDGSSQPAQTQETPVSGSAEQTILLLLAGIGITAMGTIVWKRTS